MSSRQATSFGVSFHAKKSKEKDGKLPIYARITVDGQRVELSIKRDVEKGNWDDGKGSVKGSKPEIKALKVHIEEIRRRLFECFDELFKDKKLITAEAIKNKYVYPNDSEYTLLKLFDYHNDQLAHTVEWGTLKNYFTTKKYLELFLKEKFKTNDVFLTQVNYKFLVDLEYFIKVQQPLNVSQKCGHNTTMKHMERLKKVLNIALKNEWLKKNPFANFRLSYKKVDRGFLTLEELAKIEEKVIQGNRLQKIRDLFVFGCYTGISYIDAMNLTTDNLIMGLDGEQWLATNRQKTDEAVRLPLLPKALELIEKYRYHPESIKAGKLFPSITNQRLNIYLKELADLCGVEKRLTFHIARHTFATTVTLTNGVPIESVSKMLGHSSIRTTQIYARVLQDKLSEDMKNLKERLGQKQMEISHRKTGTDS